MPKKIMVNGYAWKILPFLQRGTFYGQEITSLVQGAATKYPDFSCSCLSTCSYLHKLYMSEQNLHFIAYESAFIFTEKCVHKVWSI